MFVLMNEITRIFGTIDDGNPQAAAHLLPLVDDDLLALDDAIDRLASKYPDAAELVKLRFFAVMNLSETAESMQVSLRTAKCHWTFAPAWRAADLARERSKKNSETRGTISIQTEHDESELRVCSRRGRSRRAGGVSPLSSMADVHRTGG
jgi:hypothetical protein